ncbi:serine/threonine protein kinase [Nocardia tenerifensis]|uniref:Serine/threonine protein kinase n=1 Tax=Nocardia tenerifensis TaxID=228006 RepID=A0A318K2T8_9NOCA|nr:serine/threonine-protein kinase [Nocardia tenerifensis]PXX63346.1 serine/threonine protein kinase [Nocardia tenerifensis]
MSSPCADAVARFAADWQRSLRADPFEPPPLADYVPDGTRVRLTVLADLLRIDLRERWARDADLGKRIAEYRKEFPELEHSPELADLLCAEFLARRRHASLTVADFLTEYPDLADEMRDRFAAFDIDDFGTAESSEAVAALADLTPGRRIDDFDLITDLGTGSLGRVFLARQRSMQRLVAVRLSAGRASAPRTMAQLDHAHIVRVFDQRLLSASATEGLDDPNGWAARDSAGLERSLLGTAAPRLVYMQYLPGGTAVGVLDQRRTGPETDGGALLLRAVDAAMEAKGEIRPSDSSVRAEIAGLSWPETVAWVGRRLADALDYAEHHGVLHHDIKPANVLFTAEGIPKLADFALSEAGPRPATANPESPVDDSLPYRSPEQLARLLDPASPAPGTRSDIYSLGVLLWEMLTGTSPFDETPESGDSPGETYERMLAVRRDGLTDAAMAQLPADTPTTLCRVLRDCLHADPKRRWRNGSELAGQLDLCLDARARNLADPPRTSLAHRARGWLIPFAALCIGVPNMLASWYNIQLNQSLIIDRMSADDQHRFATVGLVNNLIAFPVAALLLIFLTRRPLTIGFRLARGREYSARTLAKARRDTLLMGDWAVLVPFGFWLAAGVIWPLGLAFTGVDLPPKTFLHFFAAQVVCAAIALAYPFFPIMVYAVRSVYPQLLVRGGIGPGDERQLRNLARRGNFYLGVAASVPLLGVAGATFVDAGDLEWVIVPVRVLSVGGILAFVVTYRLFRWLEADLLALARAIPQRKR